jgi:hypothetical protein
MGQRGELFSTRVLLQNRTYFFNVKENRMGDLYLNIVESKNRDEGGFDRQSVILFADDLQDFLKGFDESLHILEKEVRERRRSARPAVREDKGEARSGRHEKGERHSKHPGTTEGKKDPSPKQRKGPFPLKGRRVVVKKK